jgi:pimeloyl-ACP methyl ester carboxylesterase
MSAMMHVHGVDLELVERGAGQPLLILHGGDELRPDDPVLGALAERYRVIAPSHPGFGRSSLPEAFDTADDLAYFYLDLLDELDLASVVLMGFSFGGWVAAEMAVKCCHRLAKLILVDAVGIKVSDRETRDIADIFALSPDELDRRLFHNPALARRDLRALTDDELAVIARNRESLALFGWDPYLHNPKLRGRLHRITVPTLLIWGESDGVVSPAYGAAYRDAIPGARLEVIAQAGHAPQVEQPQTFIELVCRFIDEPAAGRLHAERARERDQ